MRKEKLLKRDFDAAVKHPWSTTTCLVAQAARRIFGRGWNNGRDGMYRLTKNSYLAHDAMNQFDSYHQQKDAGALASLRASLPITVNLP